MENSKTVGRICYGLGIAGMGCLHFFYPGFRPIILPVPPAATAGISILVYLFALCLVVSGILIIINKKTSLLSLVLGFVLLLFVLFGQLPIRLQHHPDNMGYWTDAVKLLALTGGAFMMANLFSANTVIRQNKKIMLFTHNGKYLFAFMLVFFGIGHLLHPVPISKLVPPWIPLAVFWTIVAGIALIGSGLSIFISYQTARVSLLLALMLFLWLVLLHLYYAVKFPYFRDGENIIGCFECLAFCGTALLAAQLTPVKNKPV